MRNESNLRDISDESRNILGMGERTEVYTLTKVQIV